MYALYASAALFFGFCYLAFKAGNKTLGNVFLTLALFLNPLGYDVVVYAISLITKDYWTTMSVMYFLAGGFFVLFMFLYNINPIKAIKKRFKETHNRIKTTLNNE